MPVAGPPHPAPHGLSLEVAPSAAIELFWALAVDGGGSPLAAAPAVTELHARLPGLAPRVAALWPGELARLEFSAGASLPELVLLADAAGAATGEDPVGLVVRLEEAASAGMPSPALRSESAADAAVLRARLDALRSDGRQRAAWLAVVGDAAAALAESWSRSLRVLRRAARARSSQLPWTDPAAAVAGWASSAYGNVLAELLARAAADGRTVLVSPTAWSPRGLLLDGPEHLLLAIPALVGPGESRARTEAWSGRLKALADPTRLAMLDWLASTPRTVTQLADDFGLAQPTVSRHVAVLRRAGLVADTRSGAGSELSTDAAGVQELLDALAGALGTRAEPRAAGEHPGLMGAASGPVLRGGAS